VTGVQKATRAPAPSQEPATPARLRPEA
jgi:hypothetical protein